MKYDGGSITSRQGVVQYRAILHKKPIKVLRQRHRFPFHQKNMQPKLKWKHLHQRILMFQNSPVKLQLNCDTLTRLGNSCSQGFSVPSHWARAILWGRMDTYRKICKSWLKRIWGALQQKMCLQSIRSVVLNDTLFIFLFEKNNKNYKLFLFHFKVLCPFMLVKHVKLQQNILRFVDLTWQGKIKYKKYLQGTLLTALLHSKLRSYNVYIFVNLKDHYWSFRGCCEYQK